MVRRRELDPEDAVETAILGYLESGEFGVLRLRTVLFVGGRSNHRDPKEGLVPPTLMNSGAGCVECSL